MFLSDPRSVSNFSRGRCFLGPGPGSSKMAFFGHFGVFGVFGGFWGFWWFLVFLGFLVFLVFLGFLVFLIGFGFFCSSLVYGLCFYFLYVFLFFIHR